MRPKKIVPTNELDLYRSRLEQIINPRHELVQLAGKLDWAWIDGQIAPLFADQGRPAVPTRFMVGLLLNQRHSAQSLDANMGNPPEESIQEKAHRLLAAV